MSSLVALYIPCTYQVRSSIVYVKTLVMSLRDAMLNATNNVPPIKLYTNIIHIYIFIQILSSQWKLLLECGNVSSSTDRCPTEKEVRSCLLHIYVLIHLQNEGMVHCSAPQRF